MLPCGGKDQTVPPCRINVDLAAGFPVLVVAGLVLGDFGKAEVADTTPIREALRP